jgi:hypothetical protein
MKGIHFPFLILFAMSIQLARSAEAPALIERPQAEAGPTRVSVGIWMVDITNIDSAQQTFTADIAVVLRWKDTRLAHTGSGVVHYPLDQVWNPRVVIVNETNSVNRRLPESVYVDADGTVRSVLGDREFAKLLHIAVKAFEMKAQLHPPYVRADPSDPFGQALQLSGSVFHLVGLDV